MDLINCVSYLAEVGTLSFFIGRLLPKSWFKHDDFPYKSFAFEKDGNFYNKLYIRKWQNRIPDMSRLLPGVMPLKRLAPNLRPDDVEIMLKETCVAEVIHFLLCLAGLRCIWMWPGAGGIIISVIYILGNMPFMMVQRYNRPKLQRLYIRLLKRGGENSTDSKEITV